MLLKQALKTKTHLKEFRNLIDEINKGAVDICESVRTNGYCLDNLRDNLDSSTKNGSKVQGEQSYDHISMQANN